MSYKRKPRRVAPCIGGCGRIVENIHGACVRCIGANGMAPRPEDLAVRPCGWCGRAHALHRGCESRAERAAETVRLWLYEGVRP